MIYVIRMIGTQRFVIYFYRVFTFALLRFEHVYARFMYETNKNEPSKKYVAEKRGKMHTWATRPPIGSYEKKNRHLPHWNKSDFHIRIIIKMEVRITLEKRSASLSVWNRTHWPSNNGNRWPSTIIVSTSNVCPSFYANFPRSRNLYAKANTRAHLYEETTALWKLGWRFSGEHGLKGEPV